MSQTSMSLISAMRTSLTFMLAALISSLAFANNGGVDSLRSEELNYEAPAAALKKSAGKRHRSEAGFCSTTTDDSPRHPQV